MNFAPKFCRSLVSRCIIAACLSFLPVLLCTSQFHARRLFCAFNNTYYWKAIGTGLLSGIYTFLWTLLLIVPGIIKGLSYAMALYIVSDNPEIGCDEAIERSMAMMRGHKMRLFLMQLGMIGWSLLSLLTLGIAMLWIVPYYQTVFANFYLEIKAEYEAAGNAA